MDHLDRTLAQINQTEEEVYEALSSEDNRLRSHNKASLYDHLAFSSSSASIENLMIVEKMAESNSAYAGQAHQLRELIGARAWALMAKVHVIEEFNAKVEKNDAAADNDLDEAIYDRDEFVTAYDADCSKVTGDAKIFKEQIDALRAGEMGTLMSQIAKHDEVFTKRAALYADYFSVTQAEGNAWKQ